MLPKVSILRTEETLAVSVQVDREGNPVPLVLTGVDECLSKFMNKPLSG